MGRRILFFAAVWGVLGLGLVPHTALATVSNTGTSQTTTGSGGTEFPFDFGWYASADIAVTLITVATAAETVLTEDLHYSLARVGAEGGNVSTSGLYGAVSSSYQIRIDRTTPRTQVISLRGQGRYQPSVIETALDKLTFEVQEAISGVAQSEDTAAAIDAHIASSDDHTAYARLAGRAGGQTLQGGTAASETLNLQSTAHGTKGFTKIDTTLLVCDETNNYVGINDATPSYALDVTGDVRTTADVLVNGTLYGGDGSGDHLDIEASEHAVKGKVKIGIDTLVCDATNSRVGINKATPTYALDVVGDEYLTGDAYVAGTVYGSTGSGGHLDLEATSHGTKGMVKAGIDTLVVDATNSYVGINDATPSYPLDVTGAAQITGNLIVDTSTLFVNASTNRVGIANASPTTTLDVGGNVLITGSLTVASGNALIGGSLTVDSGASNYIFGGADAGDDLVLQSTSNATRGDVQIGSHTSYGTALKVSGADGTSDFSSNYAGDLVMVRNDGNAATREGIYIQVGTDAAGAGGGTNVYLDMTDGDGDAICTLENTNATTIALVCPSDARLKKNIRPSRVQALATINAIQISEYDWRDPEKGHIRAGIVAQHAEHVLPEMVNEKPDGTLATAPTMAIPVMMKAIQELSAQVEALQAEIDETHRRCGGY